MSLQEKATDLVLNAKYPAKTPVQALAFTPFLMDQGVHQINLNYTYVNKLDSAIDIFVRRPTWSGDIGSGNNFTAIHELYIRTDLNLGGSGLNYRDPANPTTFSPELLEAIESGARVPFDPNNPEAFQIHHINGNVEPFRSDPNNLIFVTNEEAARINNGTSTNTYETQNYDAIISRSLIRANGAIFFKTLWTVSWMGFLLGFLSELIYTIFMIGMNRKKFKRTQIKEIGINLLIAGILMGFYSVIIWSLNFLLYLMLFRLARDIINQSQIIMLAAFINLALLWIAQWIISIHAENKAEKETMQADGHKRIWYLILTFFIVMIGYTTLGFLGGVLALGLVRILFGNKKYHLVG